MKFQEISGHLFFTLKFLFEQSPQKRPWFRENKLKGYTAQRRFWQSVNSYSAINSALYDSFFFVSGSFWPTHAHHCRFFAAPSNRRRQRPSRGVTSSNKKRLQCAKWRYFYPFLLKWWEPYLELGFLGPTFVGVCHDDCVLKNDSMKWCRPEVCPRCLSSMESLRDWDQGGFGGCLKIHPTNKLFFCSNKMGHLGCWLICQMF